MNVSFHVAGVPQPGGSKRHVGNGIIIDSNPKAKDWKQLVAFHAARACPAPLDGPLALTITFLRQRPKVHYRRDGRIKPGALHEFPTTKPDLTKLLRSTEDALKGIAWRDDSQVCDMVMRKRYVREGEAPGALVTVARATR